MSGIATDSGVVSWVCDGARIAPNSNLTGIGYVAGNTLTAGIVFGDWNYRNIFAHARIEGAAPRGFWFAFADYAFNQLGCDRVTAVVDESHLKIKTLLEHVGFIREAAMKSAAGDGGDRVIYVLWRDGCRMLTWGKRISWDLAETLQ